MNASKQAFWIFITLLALASSGWYFASSPLQVKLDKITLDNTVDAIARQLSVKQFNAEGKMASLLVSPKMHHIPKDNIHWLQTPFIQLSQTNKPSWKINANQAISEDGGEKITFKEQVVIHQASDAQTQESTLKTEILFYEPKSKYAWTEEQVIYEQAGNIAQSKGMKAYLDEKHIQLLSEARATYVPKQG